MFEEYLHAKNTERAFREWLRVRWGKAFPSFVEPSRGSTVGMADVMLQLPGNELLLPVELKIGVKMTKRNVGRIRPQNMRAEQISWHNELARSGGRSCLLLGVPQGREEKWRGRFKVYLQPRCHLGVLRHWRKGWEVGPQFIAGLTCLSNDLNQLDLELWKTCMALGQPRPASQEPAGAEKGLPM